MGRKRYRRNGRHDTYSNLKAYLTAIKTASGCVCCGERNSVCLDYHHLDPTEKRFHLGNVRGRTKAELDEEMKKCVVVCANCHRKINAGLLTL